MLKLARLSLDLQLKLARKKKTCYPIWYPFDYKKNCWIR